MITTVVVAVDETQVPIVAETVYVPAIAVVALVITGFCAVELKLLGPDQL